MRIDFNIDWKRTLLITADVVLAVYMVLVLISWHKPKVRDVVCNKVVIRIEDERDNVFLDEEEVKKLLEKYDLYPMLKSVSKINTRDIEHRLVKMPFVKTAQCHINQAGDVYVAVTQRTPVVRVKAESGDDYYIDDNAGIMPNSQYTSDMIVATGNIDRNYAVKYIYHLARLLMADDLWRNQIEQIHVLADRSIELVPRVGDNIINIGQLPVSNDSRHRAEVIEEFASKQLNRLQLFYKHGLCHAGWKKYDYISLEFSNQIVCHRRQAATDRVEETLMTSLPTAEAKTENSKTEGNKVEGNKTEENKKEGKKTEEKKEKETKKTI